MLEKVFVLANAKLKSPLSVSNGRSDKSKKDIILNGRGEPFVPGTSIAGPLRSYLSQDEANRLFGYIHDQESSSSSVIVYDADFEELSKCSIRDNVALNADKTAVDSQKFDYEIIESGSLKLRFEFTQDDEAKDRVEDALDGLFAAVNSGEIRFGSKKSRGNGQLMITSIYKKRYKYGEPYYRFYWDEWKPEADEEANIKEIEALHYDNLVLSLKQEGGISIREYTPMGEAVDFQQLTCGGEPIIPGTSWAGALRHQAKRILEELKIQQPDYYIDYIFGSPDKNYGASKVVICDSMLKEGTHMPMTRNKLDRLDQSPIERALYSEVVYYNGTCDLVIMVPKNEAWINGLFELIFMDITNGFLAVGGETAIGRGLFSLEKSRNGSSKKTAIDAFIEKFPEVRKR